MTALESSSLVIGQEARERLRDQQRREGELLTAVLAVERQLIVERQKADVAIARVNALVSQRQFELDSAVSSLAECSGVARASALLATTEPDLSRLLRRHRRASSQRAPQASSD